MFISPYGKDLRKGFEMHDLFFLYFVCPRAVEDAFSKALYMSKGYAKTSKKKNSLPVSFHQRWVELLPMKAKRNQVHRFNDALILFFLLLMIFKMNYPLYLFLF